MKECNYKIISGLIGVAEYSVLLPVLNYFRKKAHR